MRVLAVGAHEGQVDVHVWVDKTGENKLAGRVDDLGAVGYLQILADVGDGFVFDIDVGLDAFVGGDDLAAPDK